MVPSDDSGGEGAVDDRDGRRRQGGGGRGDIGADQSWRAGAGAGCRVPRGGSAAEVFLPGVRPDAGDGGGAVARDGGGAGGDGGAVAGGDIGARGGEARGIGDAVAGGGAGGGGAGTEAVPGGGDREGIAFLEGSVRSAGEVPGCAGAVLPGSVQAIRSRRAGENGPPGSATCGSAIAYEIPGRCPES